MEPAAYGIVRRVEDRRASRIARNLLLQQCLGKQGYPARLVGLKGKLMKYNGQLVWPRVYTGVSCGFVVKVKDEQFNSLGTNTGFKPRELVVHSRHCHVIDPKINTKKDKAGDLNDSSNSTGFGAGVNLGLKAGVQSLTAQLRASMKMIDNVQSIDKNSPGIREVFMQFDTDENGEIDKDEFVIGCLDLGIPITRTDVECMWPMFDRDDSGGVDVDELLDFAKLGAPQKDVPLFRQRRDHLNLEAVMTHKLTRKKDIAAKTSAHKVLAKLAIHLKKSVLNEMETNHLCLDKLYNLFDFNGNGGIDKSEFVHGLIMCNIEIPAAVIDVLWPLFELDEVDELTRKAWKNFFTGKPWDVEGRESRMSPETKRW